MPKPSIVAVASFGFLALLIAACGSDAESDGAIRSPDGMLFLIDEMCTGTDTFDVTCGSDCFDNVRAAQAAAEPTFACGDQSFRTNTLAAVSTTVPEQVVDGEEVFEFRFEATDLLLTCLLYTSPSPRDQRGSRMPSSA